jgi:predicted PurR-regulated permease PerM
MGAQASTVGLFLIALIVCLELARPILLPVVAAIIVGTMFGPLTRRADSYGLPSWLSAALVLVALVVLLQLAMILVSQPIADVIGKAPDHLAALQVKLNALEAHIPGLHAMQESIARGIDVSQFLQPVLGFLTPALGEIMLFLLTLFFFLVGRVQFRRQLVLIFRSQDVRLSVLRILNDVERRLTRYICTVSLINLGVGAVTGLGAFAVGLPRPLLWGVFAFVCNFVPYLGPALVTFTLFAVGVLTFPLLPQAFVAPALFVAFATLEGHLVTPSIVGHNLTLNPFAVFLSLAFWTWLWGAIGGFLSVPFLIIAVVAFNHLVFEPENKLPEW